MDLRQLRYVVALAEEGHFGRAAERLCIVPSALSMQVRALEDELGGALFNRTTRRVELTEAGRALVDEARGVQERVDALRLDATRRLAGKLGRVRIGFAGGLGLGGPMVDDLRAFRARHPDVEFVLKEFGPGHQIPALLAGEIDLGYTTLLVPAVPERLHVHRAWPQRWSVLMSDMHPLAGRQRPALSALAEQAFVTYGRDQVGTGPSPLARIFGQEPARHLRVDSALAVLTHVLMGDAVTLAPASSSFSHLPGLVGRPVAVDPSMFKLALVGRKELASAAAVRYVEEAGPVRR